MKNIIITVAILFVCAVFDADAQTYGNHNYVVKSVRDKSGIISNNIITYYDGLGRWDQTVRQGASPQGRDIVDFVHEYDNYGRRQYIYMPYAEASDNDGSYKMDVRERQERTFESKGDEYEENCYSGYEYVSYMHAFIERVTLRRKPGKDYYNKSVQYSYDANHPYEVYNLRCVDVNTFRVDGFYQEGGLYKETANNEDGVVRTKFTDKNGRLILERIAELDTYYVYDAKGLLKWVLTPNVSVSNGVVFRTESVEAERFIYCYRYDGYNHLVMKRIPGADWEYYVNDLKGRPVLIQDGNMREESLWKYNVYDRQGNLTDQYIVETLMSREQLQEILYSGSLDSRPGEAHHCGKLLDDPAVTLHSRMAQFRFGGCRYMPEAFAVPADLSFKSESGVATGFDAKTTTLLIYDRTYIMDENPNDGQYPFTERAYYYDELGRIVQTVERNVFGKISRVSIKYDSAGNIVRQKESHQHPGSESADVLDKTFVYDRQNRLLSESSSLNSGTPVVKKYSYDEMERMVETTEQCGSFSFATAYDYNFQGWLKSINNDYLDYEMFYYDANPGVRINPKGLYSGNISQIAWQHTGPDIHKEGDNIYSFSYDNADRLTSSIYREDNSFLGTNKFREYASYDKNGNIGIIRYDENQNFIDYMCNYEGNALNRVRIYDGTNVLNCYYSYDANGNRVVDGRQGLELKYNFLNLIAGVSTTEGDLSSRYLWDSKGDKVSARSYDGSGNTARQNYYLGSFIYETKDGATGIKEVSSGSSRFVKTSTGIETRFYVNDHLGSTRVIVNDKGEVLDRYDYYPHGLRWPTSTKNSDNRYSYNGKEEQTNFSLDYLDYGARMYDLHVPIWNGVDPLAEKYYRFSPYAFTGGNPVNLIDRDGRKLYPVPGTSKEFMNKFSMTVEYMNSKGTGGLLKQINDHPGIVYISETTGPNKFNVTEMTIYWNPEVGIITTEGHSLSPATVLNHEADHAKRALSDPEGQQRDGVPTGGSYGNKEEERVITGSEQETALKHGEIKPGEVTRKDHSGYPYKTVSPISTEEKNPIIVTPK